MKNWTDTFLFLTGKMKISREAIDWFHVVMAADTGSCSVLVTQFQKYPAQHILTKE